MKADYYNKRQLELVEFAEQVYHSRLRHKGLNGALYEDILIDYLRKDVPNKKFYKGQIKLANSKSSKQFDVIICKKNVEQLKFLTKVTDKVNILEPEDVLGVIELKKWGNPKMISPNGPINNECKSFKSHFPDLKYFFVSLRFKDRKTKNTQNWNSLKGNLLVDDKFCFLGRVNNEEWNFPWKISRFDKYDNYLNEYQRLVEVLKSLPL